MWFESDFKLSDISIDLMNDNQSIHSSLLSDIYDIPIDVIIRPIPSELDESKVESLMQTIEVITSFRLDLCKDILQL